MIEVFRKIWDFSDKERKNLQKSMIIGFLNAMCHSLLLLALYVTLEAITSNSVTTQTAITVFAIMSVSILGKIITQYFSQLQRTHAGYFMVANKRIDIGQRLKSVPMGYFNENNLGKITAIETTILNDVESAVPVVLVVTLGGFLNSLAMALFMLCFEWRLGALALAGIAMVVLVSSAMEKKSREGVPKRQNAQLDLVDAVLETIQGMAVVKAFNIEQHSDKKVDLAIEESRLRNEILEKQMTPYVALQQLVLSFFSVAMLYLAISLYLEGEIPMAKCMMMIISSFLVFEQLKVAGSCVANMRIAEHSIDKANEINQVPQMVEGTKVIESTDIKLENVCFSYESKEILNHVSLTIPSNKMTAIVGHSGAGKTTLCRLIPRFWDVTSGNILIGGQNIKDVPVNQLMSHISMVFQNVYLFQDTIANNIKFGKENASREDIEKAAKLACCHDFIMKLPDKYDTIVGEGGASLSGGEKQRISIARALIKDAKIIIFDEATANVDPENEDKLQEAMESLCKEKTVIMIAHRLKTVKNAEKIIVLEKGKVVQEGTHSDLIQKAGIYQEFIQSKKEAIGWKLGKQN